MGFIGFTNMLLPPNFKDMVLLSWSAWFKRIGVSTCALGAFTIERTWDHTYNKCWITRLLQYIYSILLQCAGRNVCLQERCLICSTLAFLPGQHVWLLTVGVLRRADSSLVSNFASIVKLTAGSWSFRIERPCLDKICMAGFPPLYSHLTFEG